MSRTSCNLRDRCGLRQMVVAVLIVALVVYIPAVYFMEGIISSTGGGRRHRAQASSLSESWRWRIEHDSDWYEGAGGEKKRYQDEVDELKLIAQSLREEISRFRHMDSERRRAAEGGEENAHKLARPAVRRPKLSVHDAAVMAGQVPKEGESEYDMRCPQPVDDVIMPLSPVQISPLPDVPKLMPRPESLADYPLPRRDSSTRSCTVGTCLDLGRCSMSRPYRVFVYNATWPAMATTAINRVHENVYGGVVQSGYLTRDDAAACIFVVVVAVDGEQPGGKVAAFLKALPFWRGDGRNHIVIDSATGRPGGGREKVQVGFDYGNAILASMYSGFDQQRANFDVFLPTADLGSSPPAAADGARHRYVLLPTYRPSLLSFSAEEKTESRQDTIPGHYVSTQDLSALQARAGSEFALQLKCSHAREAADRAPLPGWYSCGDLDEQSKRIADSTFTLLIEPLAQSAVQLREFLQLLLDCMRLGSVPVVLRTYSFAFPFEEVFDWTKAAVVLPAARVSEVNYILAHVYEDDILEKRRQGRFLWETYFSSAPTLVQTVVNCVRRRVGLPANPLSLASLDYHLRRPAPPPYAPLPSPTFQQNFTYESLERWNSRPGGMLLPPMSPFTKHKPSGWEYIRRKGDERKLHPAIRDGAALWGETFQNYLAGTREPERFTVVLLTYRRPLVLYNALQRLANLARLDRVIVVWNDDVPPGEDVSWPTLNVPLDVVKVKHNSLNNRFLPLDSIRTEAVLSLDDDTQLRHEEIDFAFRAWRENRHRLVGFPGRFHSWDSRHGGWSYNANYSCELSMVLTGAAFVHKFYLHMYSQFMDSRIREHVDKVMNCEDIAMNMLISHLNQQPPIKVTLRWTFHCAGCADTLSDNTEHFNERHQCMNMFADIYGYMPLVKTQARADSVLFKTRVAHDRGKCYMFV